MNINVEILKCRHGVYKTSWCGKCEQEKREAQNQFHQLFKNHKKEMETRVPILRGCSARSEGGCFCTGACQEIIGYRDKLPSEY